MSMSSNRWTSVVLLMAFAPLLSHAQTARPLTPEDLARLEARAAADKATSAKVLRQAEASRQRDALRRKEEALAYDEQEQDEAPATPSGGAANVLGAFTATFNSEMARKQQEDAQRERFLQNVRREAEAADRQYRQEQERQRVAADTAVFERQQAGASRPVSATAASGRVSGTPRSAQPTIRAGEGASSETQVAEARDRALEAAARAERARLAQAQTAPQVDRDPLMPQSAPARNSLADENRRKADAQRVHVLRQAEQQLLSTFRGRVTTCIGGGKDVLYLQSPRPPRTGCNVRFEARCPSTPAGAGVTFGQANYVGGSCMGVGDAIRVGVLACEADQVRLAMTQADCGAGM